MGNGQKRPGTAESLDTIVSALRAVGQRKVEAQPNAMPSARKKVLHTRRVLLAESVQSLPPLIAEDHPYDQLMRIVAAYYGVEVGILLSESREQPAATVRQIVMHLMECVLEVPRSEIARVLKRDHTSVIHGCRKIADLRATRPQFDARLCILEQHLAPLRDRVAQSREIENRRPSPTTPAVAATPRADQFSNAHSAQPQPAQKPETPALQSAAPLSEDDLYQMVIAAWKNGQLGQLAREHEYFYRVLALRFCLDRLDTPAYRTLDEVGKLLGEISRQRAHQLVARALELLGVGQEKRKGG